MEPPPPALTFETADTAAVRDDKKLVYYTNVYNFDLEANITTALKNIIKQELTAARTALAVSEARNIPNPPPG